ncbi:MAG: topoisomerase [Kyrpidia sp.]|nr:topoisomerase [Kyrpidia sp.]
MRHPAHTGRFAILVEGKNDRARLRRIVPDDVLILCTNGIPSHEKLMALHKQVGNRQAVILTDNDASGKRIRRLLAEVFPDALHAYTKAGYAGVEGTPLDYLTRQLEKTGVLDPEWDEHRPGAGRDPCGGTNGKRK